MEALTTVMAQNKEIRKVYLIDQDYSFGHAVADAAVAMLKRKRPDIEIVGNEFHPIGQVKDFAPYVAKIKASGAEAVITGNWGNDMSLLVKAGREAGLDVDWYTYYAGGLGTPTAMGEAAAGPRQDRRRIPFQRRAQQGRGLGRGLPQAGAQGQPGLLLPARQDHVRHARRRR